MFLSYLRLGFEHIIPWGADHALFVAGLFLSAATLPALVWQVSAFTAAHALTLALAATGVLRVPSSVVEPLIALSIAAIALENILTRRFHWHRPLVVFTFGLLHGLGFGGALQDLGLPPGDVVVSLLGFNAGVEAGQLAVIALLAVLLGPCRGASWYRARVVVPASAAIGLVGCYWAIQRL
ncbi:MAG: HupE/UreJ family protein [Vicinamibacterales bacterium]